MPDADCTMRLLAGTAGAGGAAVAYRRCSNAGAAACNWLVAVDDPDGLCRSCRLTRTVPDRTDPDAPAAFAAAEDETPIGMRHFVRAVAQEYGKQGRLTLEADFERFHELIRVGNGR